MKNTILELPLTAVMRAEIALPLQQMLQIHSVGGFLKAWRSPRNQRTIEQIFDTPQQARHAAATCAAWLGVRTIAEHRPMAPWWSGDEPAAAVGAQA